jgi:hypothetical protein
MNAHKLIGTVALGAALFVPVAQAQSPDAGAGLRGPGGVAALQATNSPHPDNRADAAGPPRTALGTSQRRAIPTTEPRRADPDRSGRPSSSSRHRAASIGATP